MKKTAFKFKNTQYEPPKRFFKCIKGSGKIRSYEDLVAAIGLGLFQAELDMIEDEWLKMHIDKGDIIEVNEKGEKI